MEFKDIYNRITDSLHIHHDAKQKMFWYGFIVALSDSNQITRGQYIVLRDTIETWGLLPKGNRNGDR